MNHDHLSTEAVIESFGRTAELPQSPADLDMYLQ
jgi:hypothetical protein